MLLKANPTHVLFKTDFSNAFNSLYRRQILCTVNEAALPWPVPIGQCCLRTEGITLDED
jgi:hypothetical protein